MAKSLSRLVRSSASDSQERTQTSRFCEVLLNIYLCLKYPFLYPRNRFTGLHYNNWKIQNFRKKLCNYHKFGPKVEKQGYYYKEVHEFLCSYWTVWWALPLVKIIDLFHNNVLQWFHCIPYYTELDALPKTWKEDFGLEWAEDVKQYLKTHPNENPYRITELKEKWGELDWLFPPEGAYDIERKYVERSKSICYCCGKPSTKVTPIEGYRLYYCDHCAPDSAENIKEEYV